MRRFLLPASALLLAVATLVPACVEPRPPRKPPPPVVGRTDFGLHARFREIDPIEIAVLRPTGDAPRQFLAGMRETIYRELLDRAYSPLDPDYVDARPPDLSRPDAPFALRSAVTATRRSHDGGLVVTGWVALVAPSAYGGETLYLMEMEDYSIPPVPGTEEIHGAVEGGRRLGRALMDRLPSRED